MKINSIAFMIVATLLLSISTVGAETIIGDTVISGDSRGIIYQTPHTFTYGTQKVNITYMIEDYTGNVNVVYGFDTDEAEPKSLEHFNGNEWVDISGTFQRYDETHYGMDRWYQRKDIPVEAGEYYTLRLGMDFEKGSEGKYWTCIYPSFDTIQSAIDNDRYICLDPWWSIYYDYRREINTTCYSCESSDYGLIPVNASLVINSSEEIFWGNFSINSSSAYVYYNNYTDYRNSEYQAAAGTYIDEGNGTEYGNYPNSLEMWFPFNDSLTDKVDNIVLSESGSGSLTTGGIIGRGYNMPAAADYLYFPAGLGGSYTSNTISIWIKPEHPMNSSGGIGANGDRLYRPEVGFVNDVFFAVGDGRLELAGWCDGGANLFSTTDSWDMEYDNVVIRWNSTQLDLWVNGTLESSCAPHASLGSNWNYSSMKIGYRGGSWGGFEGIIDNLMGFNEHLSDDTIRFMYERTANTNIGAEQERANTTIEVSSPLNDTYERTSSLNLTWYILTIENVTCDESYYSLNGGANISTLCSNTTIAPSTGQNYVQISVKDAAGTWYQSEVVYFTMEYGAYDNVCIYDEMNPTTQLQADEWKLQVFCDETTLNYTMNDSCYENLDISCDLSYVKAQVQYGSDIMWRTLIPDFYTGNLTFYLTNTSEYDVNIMNLYIQDLTSTTLSEYVRVTKVLESGETDMIEQPLDSENKIIVHWVDGESYHLYVVNSNGVITDLKSIIADDSTAKTITVSYVDVVPENSLRGYGVLFGGDVNDINLTYSDTRERTTVVAFYVYNISNTSVPQIYATSCSPNPSCFFNYTTPNNSTRYKACYEALSTRNLVYVGCEIYNSATWDIDAFEEQPQYYALAAILIALFIIAGSTAVTIKLGLVGSCVWMLFANYLQWFSALTIGQVELYTILMVALVISIIYAFTEGEKG